MSEAAKSPGQIVMGWWKQNLQPSPEAETGAVRALRARLRSADHVLDVLSQPQVIDLHDRLGAGAPRDPIVLAALAHVLASVKQHELRRIARAFGAGDGPALSVGRLQKLMRLEDRWELAVGLRRALPLIGGACNVAALGQDFLNWSEATRSRWWFDYFGKTPPETDAVATLVTEETE